MSKSSVRAAVDASVTKDSPSVSFQTSHASTVPAQSRPSSASGRASGRWSSSQRIFDAEKYASAASPVASRIRRAVGSSRATLSISSCVRVSCQTIAGPSGRPDARSQTSTVSPWFAIPIPARRGPAPARSTASIIARLTFSQISVGSCSTQPSRA
jgi:hypothetical protein